MNATHDAPAVRLAAGVLLAALLLALSACSAGAGAEVDDASPAAAAEGGGAASPVGEGGATDGGSPFGGDGGAGFDATLGDAMGATAVEAGPGADAADGGSLTDAALNPDVLAVMSKVAQYGITQYGDAGCDWASAAFYPGLLATYEATQDPAFLQAATNWAQDAQWLVCTANPAGPTFADNECCTQTYTQLYMLDESAATAVRIKSAQSVFDSMIADPVPGQTLWNWADALFMAPPAIALMGAATGEAKYFSYLDTTYWEAAAQLFDPTTGLFWRDPPSASETSFWSRGNGWVIAGTARILDYLPPADAKYGAFVTQLKTMAAAIAPLQNQTDGLWRSNLLDASQYPNPETSGSGFFVYAMAWGVSRNVLDATTYLPVVRKGWDGLVSAVNAEGAVGWVQGVGSAPGPATQTSTAPYGAGAFLLAGSEVAKVY
jgi:unsaturated rhamnogalacturonyl hydrolase